MRQLALFGAHILRILRIESKIIQRLGSLRSPVRRTSGLRASKIALGLVITD